MGGDGSNLFDDDGQMKHEVDFYPPSRVKERIIISSSFYSILRLNFLVISRGGIYIERCKFILSSFISRCSWLIEFRAQNSYLKVSIDGTISLLALVFGVLEQCEKLGRHFRQLWCKQEQTNSEISIISNVKVEQL